MDYQLLFNLAFGGFCALASWLFKNIWTDLQDCQRRSSAIQLNNKDLELKLVQDYVRKEEFTRSIENFSSKLDKLFDQLATKADK